jgi:hypothetical protein
MELANINSKGFVFQCLVELVNSFHGLRVNRNLMLVSFQSMVESDNNTAEFSKADMIGMYNKRWRCFAFVEVKSYQEQQSK